MLQLDVSCGMPLAFRWMRLQSADMIQPKDRVMWQCAVSRGCVVQGSTTTYVMGPGRTQQPGVLVAIEPARQQRVLNVLMQSSCTSVWRGFGVIRCVHEAAQHGLWRKASKVLSPAGEHCTLAALWDSREVRQRDVPVLCSAVVAQHRGGPLLCSMVLQSGRLQRRRNSTTPSC
jgi:hypothetical protein